MTWIIIILVVAVVLGPIMYLVPNARDKRLTALRASARRCGLTVKITSVPKLDPSAAERVTAGGKTLDPRRSCTAYQVPVAQNLSGIGELMLLKIPAEPTVGVNEVLPGWSLHDTGADDFWPTYSALPTSVDVLRQALARLPEDALAVSLDNRLVACFWRERAAADSSAVEDIQRALLDLKEDLNGRFGGSTG